MKYTLVTNACRVCGGSGYQSLIDCPGAAGRCTTCEKALEEASLTAARIILRGFTRQRENDGWMNEMARIIRVEIEAKLITIAKAEGSAT